MNDNLRSTIRVAIGVAVFLIWLQLVGNPHVVETVIGLGIAIIAAWWIGRFLPRLEKNGSSDPTDL